MGMPSTPVKERLAMEACISTGRQRQESSQGLLASQSSVLQASKGRMSGSLVIIDSLSLKDNRSVWDVYFLLCEFWFLE